MVLYGYIGLNTVWSSEIKIQTNSLLLSYAVFKFSKFSSLGLVYKMNQFSVLYDVKAILFC